MNDPARSDSSSGPDAGQLLAVARLTRPHGLRGEIGGVRLSPEVLDFCELIVGRELWVRRPSEAAAPASALSRIPVRAVRQAGDSYLILLEGVTDRTAAESFKGAELCLPREALPELPEGWYWEADLVGLEVWDAQLGLLGRAVELEEIAGRWHLKIERTGGGPALIPWIKAFVREVNIRERRIRVELPLDFPV